jgi:hypothetical protein
MIICIYIYINKTKKTKQKTNKTKTNNPPNKQHKTKTKPNEISAHLTFLKTLGDMRATAKAPGSIKAILGISK